MALITWQDLVARSKANSMGSQGPIGLNSAEAKKAFDFFIKQSKWKTLSKDVQLQRIAALINLNLNQNKGKFVDPVYSKPGPRADFTYEALSKKDPNFAKGFKNYLDTPNPAGSPRTPELTKIANMKAPLKDKWNLLSRGERQSARVSILNFASKEGRLRLDTFAPLSNFTANTIRINILEGRKNLPAKRTAENAEKFHKIQRGKDFLNFFKKNNIEIFQKGTGIIYFTDPNKTQQKALDNFLNFKSTPSTVERNILFKSSHQHPLYKDTSQNLKSVLRAARNNLNETIQGYNDKGLKRFLKQKPNMLKNATMWFNKETGTLSYTPLSDLNKKDFNFGKLREELKFEIEHNRSVNDYWKKLSKDGQILAKYRLLNDVEFAHNLSVDTSRYNRGAKEIITNWIEKNPTKTTQIANLEKELGELGHRFYAGDKWRGRELNIKSGYRDTVLDSWSKALEKSTGVKWSDQFKNISAQKWTTAMKEVEHSPAALRQLGTFLGCPRTFAAEGGRIGFQTGGTGLTACVSTKLKQPGAIEKIAALPGEIGGPLSKLKNTATTFLGMLGRGGLKAAPLAAVAALGAVAEPLVKQFRSDDYSTYLSDPEQQGSMLLSMVEAETPKVDEEVLKWQYPGMAASAAAAIPGSSAMMKARKAKGFGLPRQALGPVGKFLAGSFSPLGVAATLPISVAAQVKGGSEIEDIATDPFNWMGPAFASAGARMATRGMAPTGILAKAIRMGMSPTTLRLGSRFLGMPGLALSAGLTGYDWWKNRGKDKDDEFKVRTYKDDD